jgi:hypothetical protein
MRLCYRTEGEAEEIQNKQAEIRHPCQLKIGWCVQKWALGVSK